MPLRAGVEKGGAPTARLAARSASIDRDVPDLRPSEPGPCIAVAPRSRLANAPAALATIYILALIRNSALPWRSSDYLRGGERADHPTGRQCLSRVRAPCALRLSRGTRFSLGVSGQIAVNDHFAAPGITKQNQWLLRHLDSTWAERRSSPAPIGRERLSRCRSLAVSGPRLLPGP